ncbi:MAG: reverse transcriptase family protein, partial [Dehalococcoidia bacterium]|nr:reverse transcriptase family protein [Dehalococcoidia bacterium]
MSYLARKQQDREVLNRDLLVELAKENGLRITNTWFKKPIEKLITFKIPGTEDLKVIDATKFATTDHILCRNAQKHMILDVESDTSTAFPSDHYPLTCTIKVKVFRNKKRAKGRIKYAAPSNEEISMFNDLFRGEMAGKINESPVSIDKEVDFIKNSIHEAKEKAFKKVDQQINKPYITEATMQLRRDRQAARDKQDGETEKLLHKKVRNAVRADKRKYWAELLNNEDWKEVKQTKKGFMPKYTRLKHENGVVATSEERPDILADYFEKVQWGKVKSCDTRRLHDNVKEFRTNKLFEETADIKTGDYSMKEIKTALKKMKKNKAPGPDEIPVDLIKCMDEGNLQIILEMINKWRRAGALPESLTQADVVTIFKKGDVENPGNYRPIALLQSLYKIHAALLRNRLIAGLDHRISKNQYGFRAKKSTTQPLFVARRLIDIAEASGDSLYLVFLDWAKAFDTIDHQELLRAVERFNIPEETRKELSTLYETVHFRIKDTEGISTEREQKTGIRQGCPLSPYLFTILMSAMFMDIHNEVGDKCWSDAAADAGSTELLYADDTLLISSQAKQVNLLIKTIEKHSDRYGMNLNRDKCECFALNPDSKNVVKFADNTPLKIATHANYLGGHLQANGASKPEVESRIAKAAHIFGKLKPLWKDSACGKKWKLRVFEAVVMAVLCYGLDSIVLTKALRDRLDYFQAKCIRHILKVQAAYYSKISNKRILDEASSLLHGVEGKIKAVSKTIGDRAITLLGHIVRADDGDQMKQIAIDAEYRRVERDKRRVGRPRFFWLQLTMDRAHKSIRKRKGFAPPHYFDINNPEHRNLIANAALGRE